MIPPPCPTCGSLSPTGGDYAPYDDGSRSITFPSLELSREACSLCALLWEFVRHFNFDRSSRRGGVLRIVNEGDKFSVCVDMNRRQVKGPFDIFVRPESRSAFPEALEFATDSSPLPSDTASDESLAWVKNQLDTCRTLHSCGGTSAADLPTRVLDLSPNGHKIDDDVKLLVNSRQRAKYLCLSHCWGTSGSPIMTTTANLAQHTERVPFGALSKTFQDAVRITRRLGQRYLWIDSLCIVQDDAQDWEKESARMASIYQNAFLTIAATSSRNGKGGCFRHVPEHQQDKGFTYWVDTSSAVEIFFRSRIEHLASWLNVTVDSENFPLLGRGWVFQERVLSPRILHCCDREFLLECPEIAICQCGVYSYGELLWPTFKGALSLRDKRFFDEAEWKSAVEHYCNLKLTKDTDKLPALSGIASQAGSGEYLGGLFKERLPMNLLWSVPFLLVEKDRVPRPRPPSWSWASIAGPVTYLQRDPISRATPLATVLDAQCTVMGANPYGQVQGGYIRLRGRATTSDLTWKTGRGVRLQDMNWTFESLSLCGTNEAFYPDIEFWKSASQNSLKVTCFWLAGTLFNGNPQLHALLVLRKTSLWTGRLERIGLLVFWLETLLENISDLQELVIE